MTRSGGAHDDPQDSRRLVVVDPTPQTHPVDVTPAVHRMRTAELDTAWHRYLADVYETFFASVES